VQEGNRVINQLRNRTSIYQTNHQFINLQTVYTITTEGTNPYLNFFSSRSSTYDLISSHAVAVMHRGQ